MADSRSHVVQHTWIFEIASERDFNCLTKCACHIAANHDAGTPHIELPVTRRLHASQRVSEAIGNSPISSRVRSSNPCGRFQLSQAGVMPLMPIVGLSLLEVRSHCVAKSCAIFDGFDDVSVRPSMPDDAGVARDKGVLVWLSGLDVLVSNPLFSHHSDSLVLMQSGPLSTLIVPGLPRHSIVRSRLRITGSAAKEKSTSMPRPLRLKCNRPIATAGFGP